MARFHNQSINFVLDERVFLDKFEFDKFYIFVSTTDKICQAYPW